MAKVFHLTLMLEVMDDAPHPEEWDWPKIMIEIPEVQGFSINEIEERPYPSIEEDPTFHTQH